MGNVSEVTPIAAPAPPLQEGVLEDAELVAADENRRTWWRRAIAMTIVVLIGAPGTGLSIWAYRTRNVDAASLIPPTSGSRSGNAQLATAYKRYMQHEGPARRGGYFYQCAYWLNMTLPTYSSLSGALTDVEVLAYLGAPDLACDATNTANGSWVYFFDQSASRDGALLIRFTGSPTQRVVTVFNWTSNTPGAWTGHHAYSASTQPTTAPSTQAK